ncbi:putative Ig domain-containing protein [Staphylococcus simulans]|nr:putative Ig domain-containing protein [Staphylococcus simulans]UXR34808.1 putative Ig domain-containing protein [Staphylococcus simulans]
MKKLDFLPNLRNRYSIRRFTVGTASILIGSLLFLGHNGEAKAAESTNDNTVVEASKDTSTSQQEPVENTVPQDKTTDTIQQAGNTQTTSNVLETVKTDALSKLSTFTHLTEETVKQYTAEVKQAQTEADVQAVVDKAQKAEAEAVKQAEAEQTKTVDSTKEQSAATTEVPKSTTESVKEETKADTISATTSETNNTSEAKTVTSTDQATSKIESTPLSTEQKVDKVKTELASDYDSSKVDAALAVIDTTDLTEDQIKAEVLKLLLEQGSAQKDLYSPQATKLRSAVEEPTTAVRTFSVDTSLKNEVVVTPENFNQYFFLVDDAYYDPSSGTATLTQNWPSQKGSISLDTKMNVNKDFHFSGWINLGDKYEGHPKVGAPGGDGIAFIFNPGNTHELGLYGSALGVGGLKYAFGFKLDTYVNTQYDPKGKAKPDPAQFNKVGAFGAFVFADSTGVVSTQPGLTGWKAALLDVQPENNQFQRFTIDYSGDTKDMTITYAGQTWKQNMNNYFKYTHKNEYALSIAATTGGAYNLQQVKLEQFTYTAAALLEEDFVDTDLQELIDRPLRTSGDVDKIITVQDHNAYLAEKGYKFVSEDTSYAPTYDAAKKTIKLTNASQFLVYYVKDIEAPKIGDIVAPTVDVNTAMTPLVLDITDNSKHLKTKTVTGLPAGVTFDEATNTISGTPTAVGTSTITVTATDHAGLSTTKTFTYTVVDTKAPDVTFVVDQTTEAYTPMTPINVNAEDNSKVAPTLAVTGLPTGLSFDPTTKQITGTPTTVGTSTVTVSATDGSTNVGTSTFNIVVTPNKALEALKAAVADAKTVNKNDYTPNSVAALDAKLTEAEALIAHPENGSTDQFNAKTQEVKQAKDQLVRKADKTDLEKAIAEASKYTNLDPTKPMDQQLITALANAKNTDTDQNATQKAVDDSKNSLNNAIQEKLRADAYEKLQQAVMRGVQVAKTDGYTPNSLQAVKDTIQKVNPLVTASMSDDPTVRKQYTVEQIEQATKDINDSISGLVRQADKTELQKAIDKAGTLGTLNPADTEDKAVQDKLAAANTVKADGNATKEQVDQATADLNKAIDQKLYQDALDRLNAAIKDAKGVNQADYTPASVTPFDAAIKAGEAKAADKTATPEQLDAAAKAITDAKAQLQHNADKSALEAAINKAKALGALNEADAEDKAVKDALTAGEGVKDNANVTTQQVADATKAINDAIAAKEHADALDALKAKLAEVKALDKAPFTPDSVNTLNAQVTAGDAVVAAEKSKTTEEIKAATKALTDAQKALVKQADKTELEKAIAKAGTLGQLNAADKEDKAVQDALAKANQVKADGNATPQQVAEATDTLNKAIDKKLYQDALDELNAAIRDAEAVTKANYTPETVTPFEKAVTDGKAKVADSNATPEQLKATAQAIKTAKDALKQKANKAELEKSIATAEALQPLKAGDPEDDAVKAALDKAKQVDANQNADQAAVDAAKVELDNAIKAKQTQDAADALKQAALDELKAELAKVAKIDKNNFTPDSVTPLTEKETAGNAIVANPENKTVDEIKTATQALKDAEKGLQAKSDKAALQAAIDKAEALTGLNPADAEDKAVQDALAAAKKVNDNPNASQAEVQAATKTLNDAVAAKEHADALDALKAELAKVAGLNKDQYTPNSVAPLNTKEADGKAIVAAPEAKTTEEIKAATQALKEAEAGLVDRADKTALQTAIEKAEALPNLDAADKEDKAVQDALAAAKTVKEDANATPQAVQAATKALNDAVAAKERQDALDELNKAIKAAEAVNKDSFTPDSVAPFTTALNDGKAKAADTNATPAELKAAAKAITDAQNQLQPVADKAALQAAIAKAEALKDLNPADKEDKAVQDALAAAKTVNDNANATPDQVAQATKTLTDALAAKERQDALDELQKALDAANTVKKDDYKPSTVAPFEAAVKAGEAAKADTSKTPEQLKEAAKAIKDAQDALQAKANKDELEKSIATAEGLGQLNANDPEDKAVQDALNKAKEVQKDQNADQAAVDAAKKALDDAINAKKAQDAKEAKEAADAKQAALDELKEELAKVAKLDKDSFTPNSVTPLNEKENDGKAIVANPDNKTTEDIKAATQALKDALNNLVQKADKAELQKAIDKAKTLGQLDPTDKEDKALQDAETAGEAVKADGNATPQQVAEATKSINDAIAAKERQDALDELQKALDAANTVKKDDYKPSTVTPFEAAVQAGEAAKADTSKTPQELKEAAKAIKDAQNALQAKANKAELEKSIATAEGLGQLDANDPEDKAVQDALAAAKAVEADQNADQAAVDAAKKALDDAINAKKAQDAKEAKEAADAKQAALEALKAELEKAKAVQKDNFTPDSVKPLTDAETSGQAIVDAPDGKTTKEIEAATQALKDAQKDLVQKADKAELQKAIDKATGLGQLDPADKEDKAVQDALATANTVNDNQNATPQEVQQATEALNNAIAAKEHQDALDELQKALDDAKAVKKDDYKPSTVTPFEAAVQAGEAAKADTSKTPQELKEAAKAIKDAQKALEAKANKAELEKSIATAEGLGQLDPADKEDKAVQDALNKAKEVQADPNASQDAVDAAQKALDDAINAKKAQDAKEAKAAADAKQAALDALKEELAKVAKIDKDNFTPHTVAPLTEKEDAGKAIFAAPENKTTEEIEKATQALKDAEAALQAKSDKAALQAAIDKANALGQLDPTDKEDKALQDAVTAGEAVKADGNATPQQVQEATKAITDAIAAKERQDALDALQKALDDAKTVKKDDYKPNTVAPFEAAITAGEAAKADATKTPEELKAAAKAITDAKNNLEAKTNKDELNKAITTAEGLTLDPNDKEDKAVQDALAKAKEVQADQNATQAAVDAAKAALEDAINAKKAQDAKEAKEAADAKQAALDALKQELAKAAQIDKNNYTPDSVKPLTDSQTAGQAIVDAPENKTTEEIEKATQALKDAQAGLVAKADKAELDKAITAAEGLTLDPNDKEDKAVQDALNKAKEVQANPNATQEEVNAAKDALNKAIEAKTAQDQADAVKAALDALKAEIEKAKAVQTDKFTPDSVKPLTDAEVAGQAIVDAPTGKTVEEINKATQDLKDAQAGLVAKADKTELEKSIATAEGLGQLDPADKEDKAVQDALAAAKAVEQNPNATQTEVDNAKAALDEAINAKKAQDEKEAKAAADAKQAALDALKAELEKAKAINKDEYTPDSVKPLTDAQTAGQAIVDAPDNKTTAEIEAATQALKDAQKDLVQKADKAELQKAIDKANTLGNLDANDPEDKAVQDKLADAERVKADDNATPQQVAEATKALNDAIAAKEHQDALDELNKAIDAANAVNKADYKPNTVKPLEDAVKAGEAAKADATKTPQELKDAAKAITDAQKALEAKANKDELNKAITNADGLTLDPTDAEDKAVQDALNKAKEVQADPNASQADVDAAKEALENAVNAKNAQDAKEAQAAAKAKQDALDALKAELEKVAKINKDNFTPNTVAPLTEKEEAGKAIVANPDAKTTEEIKEATQALIDAENALQAKSDKAALQAAIDKANALGELNPADAEDKAVQDAVAAGEKVKADGNATPQEVADATKAINDAIAAKEHQDALDELNKAIDAAKAVNKDDFKPNTVKPLEDAVKAGETTKADATKTPQELKDAAKAITDAQKALEAKANKDELNKVITTAEGLTLDPADKEDKAVQDALNKAKEVQADPNASQDAVDAAKAALEDAINAKTAQDAKEAKEAADAKQAALDALKAELEKAKAINKDEYTPNSVKPLTEAETTGQAIVDAPDNKTTAEIEAATQELKDAQAGLVAKADKAELDKAITTAEGLTLDPADKEDKAVQDALEKAKAVQANPNATQDEVNAAKDALNKAIEAKTAQDKADAKQAALDELKAELAKVAKIDLNQYTPDSVKPLTDKEIEGNAIVAIPDAKTTEEIKAVTQALKDAQAGLVQKADKAELQKAIDAANALGNLDAADKEDKALQDAVAVGEKVNADGNATPQQVADATKAINDAIAAKEHQDALDELQKAIDAANAINKDDFKPNTVKPLEDAVAAGEAAKADATKTPEELKEAAKAITDAQKALEAKANKDELNKVINNAEGLTLDPTDKEDKAVQDALAKAKEVQADPNASQDAVDAAKAALEDAINAKNAQDAKEAKEAADAKQAALDALKAELEKAKAINKDDYTPNSVKPLTDAETTGQAIVDAPDGKTTEEIEAATQALKDAQAGLVAKADKAELDKAINNAEGLTLDPADKEDKAVQDALEKAKAVQANPNATQDEVNAAKDALNKAIEAKTAQDKADAVNAALDALKAELEKAKAINKDDYTPNSVKPLTEAETAGQAIVDAPIGKTVEEIEAATQALKDAQAGLVQKADKSELQNAIDKANAIDNLEATDKEDKAILDAVAAGEKVKADGNATPQEVADATKAINDAIAAKEHQDALDELNKAIEDAKAVNKDDFKPNTVKPLEDAVAAGETAKADVTKTPEELKEAAKAINDAKNNLEAKANKDELNKAITEAEGLTLDPKDKEDKAVQDALDKAKAVLEDPNATQEAVDAAKDALNKAVEAKKAQDAKEAAEKQAALDALKAELEKAKSVDKDAYTPNSVKPLTDAVTVGQAIVDAPKDKTVEEIKKATQALKDAQAGLVAKADKAELDKAINNAEGLTLDPTDKEDKAVQDALAKAIAVQEDPNATQAEVDAAKDALNKAIEAKTAQDKADAVNAALEALKAELEKAKAINKDDYTPNSVEPLVDTMAVAQGIVNNPESVTVDQIKAATQALKDAQAGLVAKADKTELDKAINNAEGLTLDPTDKEDKAVQDALENAKAVQADPNASQAEVDAAEDALNKAIEAKTAQDKADAVNAALEVLKAELEKAKAINQADFTPNSVEPLVDAMAVAQGIVNNPESVTVDQIKEATQALKDAQAGLVAKADKAELDKAINNAEGLTLDPTDKEDKAVQEALEKAKAVQADANATQEAVDAAKSALEDAINAKTAQDKADAVNAALEALKAELEKAKAINKDDYTPNSVKPLVDAMAVAQGIVNNPESVTVDQIKEATQALKDAQAGLVAKADKTELDKAINNAEGLTLDPTDKEDKAVQDALDKAKAVQADANATQTEVDAAKDALNKAVEAKATQDKADALAELQKALDKAQSTDKTKYTPESVEKLDVSVNTGKAIVENSKEVSIKDIKETTKAIEDALKALEVIKAPKIEKETDKVKSTSGKSVERTSVKAVKKSEGSKAQTKANKAKVLPNTGQETPADPKYATLMLAIGGLMALFGRRKKEDKDNTEK